NLILVVLFSCGGRKQLILLMALSDKRGEERRSRVITTSPLPASLQGESHNSVHICGCFQRGENVTVPYCCS
ncbi:hypothetical protein GUJ93_ZPchr0001g32303, partial [Zizania palustris]